MNVIALTVFVGFVLVTLFVLLWLVTATSQESFSERDALLPLNDETPSPAKRSAPSQRAH